MGGLTTRGVKGNFGRLAEAKGPRRRPFARYVSLKDEFPDDLKNAEEHLQHIAPPWSLSLMTN